VYVVYYNSYFGFTIMLRCLINHDFCLPFRDVVSIISFKFIYVFMLFPSSCPAAVQFICVVCFYLASNNLVIPLSLCGGVVVLQIFFFCFMFLKHQQVKRSLVCWAVRFCSWHYSKSSLRSSMMAARSGSSDAAALLPYSLIFWISKVNT